MPRWFSKRLLLALAGVVLVVATFAYLLPTIADYRDVWRVVQDVSWEWTVALVAATAVNLVTFAPPWLALLPGLRFWPTLMMTQLRRRSRSSCPAELRSESRPRTGCCGARASRRVPSPGR